MKPVRKRKKSKHAALLGVGLDNEDGHKRITTGQKFAILGGSAETHERMTETVVKKQYRSTGRVMAERAMLVTHWEALERSPETGGSIMEATVSARI